MSDITSSLSFLTENPAAAAIKDAYNSFSDRRALLNLPNPGTVDGLAREVQKDVLLTNFMFTGLRADLTKVFGMSPLFRVSHAFAMGGSGNLPPYNFSTMYGSPKVRTIDSFFLRGFIYEFIWDQWLIWMVYLSIGFHAR